MSVICLLIIQNHGNWTVVVISLSIHPIMSQIRKLKYHEQKLLKKTNFLEWKKDNTVRESAILHRYHITRREDYH